MQRRRRLASELFLFSQRLRRSSSIKTWRTPTLTSSETAGDGRTMTAATTRRSIFTSRVRRWPRLRTTRGRAQREPPRVKTVVTRPRKSVSRGGAGRAARAVALIVRLT
uniref:Uncharacterized protein n=1 Tax=Brassica oleracea TaxID=3712 RepID=A0A3P6D7P6_BRAOL|nr:unnamed protein product [Brassica oleracea]